MTAFSRPPRWESPSGDPNDETFGDVVETIDLDVGLDAGLEADLAPDDGDADGVRDEDGDRAVEVVPEAYDVVLVGEPFDAAVVGRRGAARGPEAIRETLAGVKTHHFEAGPVGRLAGSTSGVAIGDLGDVNVSSMDPNTIQRRVASAVADVHGSGAFPVFLGGDNSMTAANVEPLLESDRGTVGVVNFDAHLDVREVRDAPSSGTPYRQLLEQGLDAYACVGARHHETSTAYAEYLADRGGTVVTSEAVGRDLEAALERARDAVADVDALYVSVDCDVLDAAAAPGVSAPTPGGLTPRELFQLVRRLAGADRVAGFEVVECAPPLDEDGRTVDAAARAIAHFLAGYAGAGDDGGGRRE